METRASLISIALIIIIGFSVYGNSLNNKFVWDDDTLIKENIYIKNWSYIPKIFSEDMGAGAGGTYYYYRPLQIFTYLLDYSIWKLNVIGYHLTNILLHILVALAIYWLINILYNETILSFLTAILFVAHPIHTEAVSYLSGRGDPLAVLFMLLCFIFYIRQLGRQNITNHILIVLTYILALLSKEISIILPLLLLFYHYAFKKRLKIKEFLSIAALALTYILSRMTILRSFSPDTPSFTGVLQRMPGFFVALTNYIRLIFLPFGLHMEYGKKLFSFGHPKAILGVIILILLLAAALKKRKSDSLIFFSIGWFFVTLLPSTNIYPPLAFYMAEHYLYLSSIGFFLILANGLAFIYKTKRLKTLAIFFVVGLLVFYSYLTINQNNYWKDPLTIYEKTLKYAPDSARVNCDLGNVYNNMGRYNEAIWLIKKAIQLDPTDEKAYNNLANSYYAIGNIKEAISLYNKALQFDPRDAKTYTNLANVYYSIGNVSEAISLHKEAMKINPNFAGSYYNLGVIYLGRSENGEALKLFTKAIELDPDFAEAYVNLAVIYNSMGKAKEAIGLLKKAINLRPNYTKAYLDLKTLEQKYGFK